MSIYYDLSVKNIENTTQESQQIRFSDLRSSPIVDKADDYILSVIRFSCDTTYLPVFIPTIKINSNDPNETIYKITLTEGAFSSTKTVIWEPEFEGEQVPSPPSTSQFGVQSEGKYYWSLNYQHFISLINKTLLSAFNDLVGAGSIMSRVPFIHWNADTLCAELITPLDVDTISSSLYFNRPLYALFSSLPSKRKGINTDAVYQIDTTTNNGSKTKTYPYIYNNAPYCETKQNYSTVSNWSPVDSIAFSSTTLPVKQSLVSPPTISFNGQIIPMTNTNNNFVSMITDIQSNQQSMKPHLIYNPSAEYRRISLNGSLPINDIDISIYFKTKDGRFEPLLLPSSGSASIKLLFEKK